MVSSTFPITFQIAEIASTHVNQAQSLLRQLLIYKAVNLALLNLPELIFFTVKSVLIEVNNRHDEFSVSFTLSGKVRGGEEWGKTSIATVLFICTPEVNAEEVKQRILRSIDAAIQERQTLLESHIFELKRFSEQLNVQQV